MGGREHAVQRWPAEREHAAGGALVRLFADWEIDAMPLYVAYPPNRYLGKALRVFIDWIVELMGQHAPVAGKRGNG